MTRATSVVVLLLLVTALGCDKPPVAPSPTGPSTASPAPPQATPLTTPFAFTSTRNSFSVIYVIDREGGEERRLTTGTSPDWSRDGRIAYESLGGGKRLGIFVINDDGSGERFIGEGEDPSWSPDGHYVAVSRGGIIYVLDVDGGAEPRVAARPPAGYEMAMTPAWSPDGRQIAFAVCNGYTDQWDIGLRCGALHAVAADGSGAPAPLGTTGSARAPAWSPDGRQVAFQSDDAAILVMSVGGHASQAATRGVNPSWTSDGRLAYEWTWQGSAGMRILLSDHGTERILIPEQPNGARNYSDSGMTVRR